MGLPALTPNSLRSYFGQQDLGSAFREGKQMDDGSILIFLNKNIGGQSTK
ncbi:hypothetical protein DesyoDRAFT_2261 [Desulfosporosinus youngiae DSM 17734]|uniref:Uncharacterized protein n=1 Tax=Desulfosporosinus youngiae DSM 17734 TaxID=768710 RepID=H5XUB0_9FIRM|nr:hypothetical protein DesyoDRAFT_2261 [Desulfosporosinus youngiae DSM 17734]